MPQPVEERRPPITPQLAVRVAVLGGIAFVLFAIVFFRLWFLQVLSGEDYVSQARENRVRKVRIEAPRGDVVDRHGTVLVKTRVAPVVQIVPSSLPDAVLEQADEFRKERGVAEKARLAAAAQLRALERDIRERRRGATRSQRRERRRLARSARRATPVAVPAPPADETELRRLYRELGRVINVRPRLIHERVIEGVAELPYSNVTIKSAVSRAAFNYIRERREQFPGVEVEKQYLRDYPHDELGAQLFGTTREISPAELKLKRYRGVEPGTRIGADGIEESYDRYLRGTDGFTKVVINALGTRDDRRRMTRKEPTQGQRLRLTLDLELQRAANDALQRAVAAASQNGAKAGAFVAMDPRNGEILALGSYPSFDANEFAKPISQKRYDELSSEELGAPLFNRAIAATYPTGSTFKPITAMAALEEGVITPDDHDRRRRQVRARRPGAQERQGRRVRPAPAAAGAHRLVGRLLLRARRAARTRRGRCSRTGRSGSASAAGPASTSRASSAGLVPDRKWRDTGYDEYRQVHGEGEGSRRARPRRCSSAAASSARGPRATTSTSRSARATCRRRRCSSPRRTRRSSTTARSCARTSACRSRTAAAAWSRRSARRPAGASTSARLPRRDHGRPARRGDGRRRHVGGRVRRLPVPRRALRQDRHGRAPAEPRPVLVRLLRRRPTRPIVVVTTIERGGFGAETAAPAARLILNEWFDVGGDREFHSGSDQSN